MILRLSGDPLLATNYDFEQTDSELVVTLPLYAQSLADDLEVDFSPDLGEISVAAHGRPPILCGALFEPVLRYDTSHSGVLFRLHCVKSEPKPWPYFITRPSSRGIDGHSLFILALANASLQMLMESVNRGSICGKIELGRKFLNGDPAFSITPLPSESLRILASIPDPCRTARTQILLAQALLAVGNREKAKATLRSAVKLSPNDRWEIIEMLRDLQEADGPLVVDMQVTQFRGTHQMMHQVIEPNDRHFTRFLIVGAALVLVTVVVGIWFCKKRKE
jgi:hypothetical protein